MNWSGIGQAALSAGVGAVTGGIGSAITSGVMGLFGGDKAEKQMQDQKELAELQYNQNSRLMAQSYEHQKAMYDYTFDKNSPASIKQLRLQAGLNPVLNSTGGVSGSIAGSGGASTGQGTAPNRAALQAAEVQAQNVMADTMLKAAQAKNIDADTKNKPKQGEMIEADIAQTLQNTKNLKAQETGQELQNSYQVFINEVNNETKQIQVDTITEGYKKLTYETIQAFELGKKYGVEAEISERTKGKTVEALNLAADEAAARIFRDNSQGRLNDTQINQITEVLKQGWARIGIEQILSMNDTERLKISREIIQKDKEVAGLFTKTFERGQSLQYNIQKRGQNLRMLDGALDKAVRIYSTNVQAGTSLLGGSVNPFNLTGAGASTTPPPYLGGGNINNW